MGPALAAAILRRFRSEEAFFAACDRLDLADLATVDGLSERRALHLVRQALGLDGDASLIGGPTVQRLHDDIVERVTSYACTAAGRNRLRLLHPLLDIRAATAHAAEVMRHGEEAASLDRDAVRRALRRLRPLASPPPRQDPTRLVVAEDDAILDRLQDAGVHRWAALEGLAGLRRAADHDLVVFVYEEGIDLEGADHVVAVPSDAPLADIVPEAVLAWAKTNRDTLEACAALAQQVGRPSRAPDVLEALAAAPAPAPTPDLRRTVEEVRRGLDAALERRVAGLSLSGSDVLAALGRRLPAPVQKAVDETLAEGRRILRERTGLDLQPFLPSFPVGTDEDELERCEREAAARGHLQAHEARRRAARAIETHRGTIESEVRAWTDFDAPFALGCFALDHRLRPARFGEHLELSGSIHLDLARRDDAQRIDYHLGGAHPVALLTGANSGGKSTLLENIAQVVLMARLGLPVAGEATLPWMDELHLVTARRGLDAGAFETFLRGFLPLVRGDARRLVLVDEVEAVTELEAAGRILGFFVERLTGSGSLGVVVTHMAPHVIAACQDHPPRVDGIEATGLDGQDRLVVDRCPRMGHFARSTPELILQRLARAHRGQDKALFDELLARLRAADPPVVCSDPASAVATTA